MNDEYLSNTYLVAASDGRRGVLRRRRRPGGAAASTAAERGRLTPTHVLLTHHHHDHVQRARRGSLSAGPDLEVLAHPPSRARRRRHRRHERRRGASTSAASRSRRSTRPGHTAGMLALLSTARRLHGRHAVQGLGRRRPRARLHDLRRPEALDHGRAAGAPPRDRHPPRAHRPDDGRPRSWRPTVRPHLARPRPRGRRAGAPRWASPATLVLLGRRLRRRPQGVGPLGRRVRRHRPRLAGSSAPALSARRWLRTGSPPRAWARSARIGRLAAGQGARQVGRARPTSRAREEGRSAALEQAPASRPPSRSSPRWGR